MLTPWLIILSKHRFYLWIRIIGAIFSGIAALAWIIERISGYPNIISIFVTKAAGLAQWVILMLAMAAVVSLLLKRRSLVPVKKPVDQLMRYLLFVVFLLCCSFFALAQDHRLNGLVRDSATRVALSGITVTLQPGNSIFKCIIHQFTGGN